MDECTFLMCVILGTGTLVMTGLLITGQLFNSLNKSV